MTIKFCDMGAVVRLVLKTDLRVLLCIGLFVLSAYSFMLSSPFKTLDDDFSIVNNTEIRDLGNIPSFFRSTYFKTEKDYYRPLVYVTYAIEYHFFGLNYFYYNLDNVLLHVLNAFLVFLLAGLLLGDRRLALGVAVLFAIHPIHWEAVGNVSGRAILLCALFVLSGYVFFLKFVRERKIGFLIGATLSYGLGLLCKESAGVFIFAAMAYWFVVERRTILQGLVFWPFFAVAGGYFVIRHAMGIVQMYPWHSWQDMGLGVASFLNGLFVYARLFVFPADLRFDRGHLVFQDVSDPGFRITVIVYGVLSVLLIRLYRRLKPWAVFCLLWFFIELFPVSQVVTSIGVYPGAISLAEHFLYVACVPVFVLMVKGGSYLMETWESRWHYSAGTIRLVLAGFLLFLFLTLIQQNIYASNEFLMLRDSLRKDPRNSRLQYSLGMVFVRAGNFDKAIEHLRQALRYHSCNQSYRIALGKALVDSGDVLAGVREYEKLTPSRDNAKLLADNKKAAYRLLIAQYEKKIRVEANPDDLFALGVFYVKTGDKVKARTIFERAWALDRGRRDALFNVAVLSEDLGDLAGAGRAYQELAGHQDSVDPFVRAARERLSALAAEDLKKTSAQ